LFDVFAGQLLTLQKGDLLAITPYYTAAKYSFGAEGVGVL